MYPLPKGQQLWTRRKIQPARAGAATATGFPLWKTAILVGIALLYWTIILRLLLPGVGTDISVGFRTTYFAVYILTLAAVFSDPKPARDAIMASPAISALILLPLVSTLWTINPSETTNRAIAVAGSSLFGLYLAAYVPQRRALQLLAMTATLAAALSLIFIFAVPSFGIDQLPPWAGSWTGAFGHKNGLGQMSSLGVIVCLIVVLADGLKQSPIAAAGCVLNAILVVGSQSLTAQLVCAVSVVMVLTIGRFIRSFVRFGPLVAGLLLLAIIFVASTYRLEDFFELLGSLGKDPTLSSRVPLWQSLAPFMMDRFWLGFGYEAFWSDHNYAVQIVVERIKFRPWYAHNGVVELWLGLGLVGVALMSYVFLRLTALAANRLYQDETNPTWQLALVFAFQFLVQNFSESTILMRNSMFWSLLVMLAYMVGSASLTPAQKPAPSTAGNGRRKIIAK